MRPMNEVDAEAWVLVSDEGRDLLAEVTAVAEPGPADLSRWRWTATADRVAAALRMASARKRGRAKFTRADRMWLDPTGLEQATAEAVARHKAVRFQGKVVFDLCAGIGGDAVALAAGARVVAVDFDQGMCRRLGWNAEVYDVADRVAPVRGRAEGVSIPPEAWVHVDPDRRVGRQHRAGRLPGYAPGLDFLRALPRRAPGGAIKLGPASDFEAHFGSPGFEVELISLRGECKEATVWFGAAAICRRRATRLPEGVTWRDSDGTPARPVVAAELSSWIFDPDHALIRSGLLDSFAASHGLQRCAAGVDFLTGPERVDTPFLVAFEVEEVFPLKVLRRIVAERGLGPLDIRPKGLDIRPEELRKRLRPPGPNPATLLLIGGPSPARAVLARRWD